MTIQREYAAYKKGIEAAIEAAKRRVYCPPICPYGLCNRDLAAAWERGVQDYELDPSAAAAMVTVE